MSPCNCVLLLLFHLTHSSLAYVALEDRGHADLDLSYFTIALSNTTGSGIESDALMAFIYWGNHSYQCNFFGATTPIPAGTAISCYVNSTSTLALSDNGSVDPDDSYRIELDYGGYNINSDSLRLHSLTAVTNNGNHFVINSFCVPLHFNSSQMRLSTDTHNQCDDDYPHKYWINEVTLDFFAVSAVRIDFNDRIYSSTNQEASSTVSTLGNVKPLKPTSFIVAFTEDGGAIDSDVDIEYTLYWDEDIIRCSNEDSSHSDSMVVCTTNDHLAVECDTDSQFISITKEWMAMWKVPFPSTGYPSLWIRDRLNSRVSALRIVLRRSTMTMMLETDPVPPTMD